MFACFQPIEFLDRESQILEGVLIQKFQSKNIRAEQIEENCKKLTLPNPIIRSSSLSKIHNSNKKLLQFQTEKQPDSKPKQLKSLKRMTKNNQNQNQLKTGPSQDIKSMIVDKLSQKNQIYSKLLKKPCNKQNLNQKQITHVPAQSFYHKHQNMDKILNIYKENTQKQLKQCTFNPKINAQSMFRKNDQKQFFKQQIEYHKKTEDKIQQIRSLIQAQKQKQNTFKPKISQQTAQMTQRRAKVDVYDRLYDGKTQEKNCTQRQNSFVKQNNQGRRPNSKKSISVLSSSRKVSNTSQTKKQKLNGYSVKKFTDIFSNNSKQLVRQKSSKMFSQLLKDRKQGNLMSNTLNPDNKNNSNNHMTLNSVKVACQKKQNLQSYGLQLLDCRELIKQKSRSNNILSKEQSCKIIKNAENPNLYETSLKKQTQNSNKSMQKTCLKQKFCVKNQRITLQRFIKEFIFVVKKNNLCSKICFSEMLAIIKDLNFIQSLEEYCELQETFELRNQSICKAKQIWRLLQGDQNEGILLVNLYKILCSILGYHNDLIKNQAAKILQASLNQNDEQGNTAKRLILSEKDSISLKKQFICLYSTRLQLGQSKFVAKQINANHFSFRPSVSKQSVEFAQKHRQKVIAQAQTLINQGLIDFQAPENGLIGHFELLALQEKIKMHKLKVMREEVQKERKKLQDQSMIQHSLSNRSVNQTSQSIEKHKTSIKNDYQLNSHNFSRISHQESQSRSKDQIFIDLYENGKHLKSNRRDRSIEQIQYQESKDELTFKPKISSKNKQTTFNKRMNLHQKIPNFTKEVMRMKKKYSNPNQQISPLLYLNVAMQGNGNVKIPVYENDSFKSLTEKVRILMNIQNGEEQRIKLTHILQDQIIPALNKIGVKSVDGFFLLRE